MSRQLINLSPDLRQLVEEGYDITIEHGHLVMHDVPYVDSSRQVRRGLLVSTLSMSGDCTNVPETHVVMFQGDYPCDEKGNPLHKISHISQRQAIAADLYVDHSFSSKPAIGYPDYYAKMSTYATIISSPAAAIDPSVTARTRRVQESDDDSPFMYLENASGRAGITALTEKLSLPSIAIVGLGGTGSFVLDLLVKTPVREIHLYDGDIFEQHNAFRAPGAASAAQLREKRFKVEHFASVYSVIHRGVRPHPVFLTSENVGELAHHNMVFLCLDANEIKVQIVASLEANNVPFIDVGMGLELVDDRIMGTLRTTLSTPAKRDHVRARARIPMETIPGNDLYAKNIQVADLNALNACLAVIRWKRLMGFYSDTENEHFSLYSVDSNHILNEDFV
ncbi:ThiF family adenylyltransferase [Rhizobium sp. GCM10022189]|uniref:ThiF family adenylyltransferase n=1 Tax=Rhizobium sp. GCM10022189 TaxID=3252654 RepID=UPI00360E9916